MKICDKDCFNCKFPDCINDEMDHEDYVESAAMDRALFMTPEKRKAAAARKAYREANREKVAAAQKAYREANREKLAAAKKAYREANREKIAAYKKAYYEANREKIAAAQKNLKAGRKRLGWSQKVAASWLGVSQGTWSNWENGGPCQGIDEIVRKLEAMA